MYARKRKTNPLAWILVIVLLIGAAYIGAAGKLGTWLAEHVIQPVFVTLGIYNPSGTATPSGTTKPGVAVSVSGFTVYGLQTGVFSDKDNAKTAADSLISQGGAGYQRTDGSSTRVLLSVYASEKEATTVRDQIKSTMETRLYPIACDAGNAYVKTNEQAQNLKTVLAKASGVRTALLEAALSASNDQSGETKIQSAKTALQSFEQELAKSAPAGQSTFVDTLDAACQQALTLLNEAKGGAAKKRSHCAQAACLTFFFGYIDGISQ